MGPDEIPMAGWRVEQGDGVAQTIAFPDGVWDRGMLRHGVTMARKGWLRKGDVMNTLPLSEIRAVLKK